MRFEVTDSLIIYRDEQPGEHATMFVDGARTPFRDDASSFNDGARSYAWAFARPAAMKTSSIIAFATGDREVFAVVAEDGNASILLQPSWQVVRLGTKPFAVEPK